MNAEKFTISKSKPTFFITLIPVVNDVKMNSLILCLRMACFAIGTSKFFLDLSSPASIRGISKYHMLAKMIVLNDWYITIFSFYFQ